MSHPPKSALYAGMDRIIAADTLEEAKEIAASLQKPRNYPLPKRCWECGVIFADRKGMYCSENCEEIYHRNRDERRERALLWELHH